jgi:hypothetical protein
VDYFIQTWRSFSNADSRSIERWATDLAGYARSTLFALGISKIGLSLNEAAIPALVALQRWGKSVDAENYSRILLPPSGLPSLRRLYPDFSFVMEARRRLATRPELTFISGEMGKIVAWLEVMERMVAGIAMVASLADAAAKRSAKADRQDEARIRRDVLSIRLLFSYCNATYERATGTPPRGTKNWSEAAKRQVVGGAGVRFYRELLFRMRQRMPDDIRVTHPELMNRLEMSDAAILTAIHRAGIASRAAIRKRAIRQ